MSNNRGGRAGTTLKLRCRFIDDLGDNATANNVYVHIFDPDAEDFTDLSLATVVSGSPTYFGEGIYEYQYDIPSVGPDGTWTDRWDGFLTGQSLSSNFNFEVSASGIIRAVSENQLYQNNIVKVTIASGIHAADGGILEEEYSTEFLTTTNPSYSKIRKVQLASGGFLGDVEDDTLQLAILEGSIEADVISFRSTQINSDVYNHARREYVTCYTASTVLTNLGNNMLRSKTLDNLRVEYDTNGLRDTIMQLKDCMAKWEPQVIAGGGIKTASEPIRVVKGDLDVDKPFVSRSWQSVRGDETSRRIPGANVRARPTGHRRYVRTWHPGKWW